MQRPGRASAVALCVLLSLLLHVGLAWLALQIPRPEHKQTARQTRATRLVKVVRQKEKPAPAAQDEPQERAVVKTNPDVPQVAPERPEFEGNRDSRAASDPNSRDKLADRESPAMTGREQDEMVTFDETRQDGDLKHEGKRETAPTRPAPQEDTQDTVAAQEAETPAPGTPQPSENPAQEPGPDLMDLVQQGALTVNPVTESDDERGLRLNPADMPSTSPVEMHAARTGLPDAAGDNPELVQPQRRRSAPAVYYDPSLADHMQPEGFRTNENRTRSTGHYTIGRHAALNVEATPRGEYEAEIYRRIAYQWYRECDEHCGDIIPGRITVSLRLLRNGSIANMDLIKRSGASVSQQSFTFTAIRCASLPPMPAAVQKSFAGDKLELIFDFNFD
ncbi:MAG: hypothetical protein Q3986_04260 [Akkermansia sp.]|nr:hypothetical protein [Akkermansia sp.]